MRYVAPGEGSTEYRKALRAEAVGLFLVACGLVCIGLAIGGGRMVETVAGIGLAFSGAHLVAHSSAGYSVSRGAAKASTPTAPRV